MGSPARLFRGPSRQSKITVRQGRWRKYLTFFHCLCGSVRDFGNYGPSRDNGRFLGLVDNGLLCLRDKSLLGLRGCRRMSGSRDGDGSGIQKAKWTGMNASNSQRTSCFVLAFWVDLDDAASRWWVDILALDRQ